MSNDDIRNTGIVPVIENLTNMLRELTADLSPLLDCQAANQPAEHIKEKMASMDSKMQRLLHSINHSYDLIQLVIKSIHTSRSELKKSVDGLIKKTGMQLQKVTSTTEEATNKILDVAEKLDEDQMSIIEILDSIQEDNCTAEKSADLFDELRQKIYQNQESAFTIMDYLQFQDITAQQIAGAYSLLSDTEKTLLYVSEMLKRFDANFDMSEDMTEAVDKKAFNMDATYKDKATIQSAIDNLFESRDENIDIPEEAAQNANGDVHYQASGSEAPADAFSSDDIDALFGSQPANDQSSQDDIDKLFSNTADSDEEKKPEENANKKEKNGEEKREETSQEEIDKLFG